MAYIPRQNRVFPEIAHDGFLFRIIARWKDEEQCFVYWIQQSDGWDWEDQAGPYTTPDHAAVHLAEYIEPGVDDYEYEQHG